MSNKNDRLVEVRELVRFMDDLMGVDSLPIKDFCPNGLQVDGFSPVRSITTAVSVTDEVLYEMDSCTLLLTHHGLFWNGDNTPFVGVKAKKILSILDDKSSLASYHLPLDAIAGFGNNYSLAQELSQKINGSLIEHLNDSIMVGVNTENAMTKSITRFADISYSFNIEYGITSSAMQAALSAMYGKDVVNIGGAVDSIKNVFVCTGAGQSLISRAINEGADCFISGEASLVSELAAKDARIAFYACGHKDTEIAGIRKLGDIVSTEFKLPHRYIDDGTVS